MKKVILYTDGGCRGNQHGENVGGIGGILIYPAANAKKEYYEGFRNTTNNRMEILAVLRGLEKLKEPCEVLVHSDSAYLVNAVEAHWIENWKKNGWKRRKGQSVKNVDLWQALDRALEKHDVRFIKVRGHADDALNNRADALANRAMDEVSRSA